MLAFWWKAGRLKIGPRGWQNNVMALEEMIESAVKQDVRFVVCTMSMGIMGIEKRDLMDLPNMEYAGVTSFVELSQRSKSTLVF